MVVTDNLVMRARPWIGDDSPIEGQLNQPTRVLLLTGPVPSDGYDWWAVVPEGMSVDGSTWVAAAGKDGEVWLEPMEREEGTWSLLLREDLPGSPSVDRAVAGADGRIYLFGGSLDRTSDLGPIPSTDAWAFDLAGCAWRQVAAMPSARSGAHPVVDQGGRIHVIGGATDTPLATVETYEPATDSWKSGTDAPDGYAYGSAVTLAPDGRIWAFGAGGAAIYDPTSDVWQVHELDLPGNGVDAARAAPDGTFWAVLPGAGGLGVIDPKTGAVTTSASPRIARYNVAVAWLPDGRVLVTGGDYAGSCTVRPDDLPPVDTDTPRYSPMEVWDPATNAWESLPPLPIELDGIAVSAIVVAGRLHVVAAAGDEVIVARYDPPVAGVPGEVGVTPGEGGCGG